MRQNFNSDPSLLMRAGMTATAAAAVVGSLLVPGYAGAQTARAAKAPVKHSVKITPDFSKLTLGGVSCEGDTPRPCYQPLYKQPKEPRPLRVTDIINPYTPLKGENGQPNIAIVNWPYEKYGTNAGDPLTVVCQVKGETISNAYHQHTNVWDVIKVPVKLPDASKPLPNQAALKQAESADPGFGIKKVDGHVTTIYAFASAMWLGDQTHLDLAACTPAENPQHYPAAA